MAKHPKNTRDAVELLGVTGSRDVLLVGPDHGYAEACTDATTGAVVVVDPPPDLEADGIEVQESADETEADVVIVWVSIAGVSSARALAGRAREGGEVWMVIPKVALGNTAPFTEGDVKRAMMSSGWRERRVVALSKEASAAQFVRR